MEEGGRGRQRPLASTNEQQDETAICLSPQGLSCVVPCVPVTDCTGPCVSARRRRCRAASVGEQSSSSQPPSKAKAKGALAVCMGEHRIMVALHLRAKKEKAPPLVALCFPRPSTPRRLFYSARFFWFFKARPGACATVSNTCSCSVALLFNVLTDDLGHDG